MTELNSIQANTRYCVISVYIDNFIFVSNSCRVSRNEKCSVCPGATITDASRRWPKNLTHLRPNCSLKNDEINSREDSSDIEPLK